MKATEKKILNAKKMIVQEVLKIENCRPYHMEEEVQGRDNKMDKVGATTSAEVSRPVKNVNQTANIVTLVFASQQRYKAPSIRRSKDWTNEKRAKFGETNWGKTEERIGEV